MNERVERFRRRGIAPRKGDAAFARSRILLAGALTIGASPLTAFAQSVTYIHTDALGTPIAKTNAAGAIVEQSEHAPFGDALNRPDRDGPGFTGHVEDAATGLTYMQQRYYDPAHGIFLSVDPVSAYDGDKKQFNRYAYAYNSPYKFTDPDGRQPWPTPQNFNVPPNKLVPTQNAMAWRAAQQAAAPKAGYTTITAGEAAGGSGFVGGKGQVLSGTFAAGTEGVSGTYKGLELVGALPGGNGFKAQLTGGGIQMTPVDARIAGGYAAPLGWEVGISSATNAKEIDGVDRTQLVTPWGTVSWGDDPKTGIWAAGFSLGKFTPAAAYIRVEEKK